MAATTAGSSQLRSGCADSNRWRYHCPDGGSNVHAGADRSKADTQLLGGEPSGGPSRHTYQFRWSLSGPEAASRNHGCRSEVWLGTQSMITFSPRAWASVHQGVEVGQGPEQGIDVAVVADVVAEVDHGGGVERGDPQGIHPQPGQIGQPVPDAGQVSDPVPVGVGEGPGVDLVEDGPLPPGPGVDGQASAFCLIRASVARMWVRLRASASPVPRTRGPTARRRTPRWSSNRSLMTVVPSASPGSTR